MVVHIGVFDRGRSKLAVRGALSERPVPDLQADIDATKVNGRFCEGFRMPSRRVARGVEMKLVLADDRSAVPASDPNLVNLVVQARIWFDLLVTGEVASARDLGARKDLDAGDVSRVLPLAFLAPNIVEAILEGRQPIEPTAFRLKRLRNLSLSWAEQHRLLGFD